MRKLGGVRKLGLVGWSAEGSGDGWDGVVRLGDCGGWGGWVECGGWVKCGG